MHVTARTAATTDIPELMRLYGLLESEMTFLSPLWPATLGLRPPLDEAFASAMADERSEVCVGEIDGAAVGFGLISEESTVLDDVIIAAVRIIFTELPAREVGVAAAMLSHLVGVMEARGHTHFDAHVLPGHRLAKNFFEASGFKARHIVMHRK